MLGSIPVSVSLTDPTKPELARALSIHNGYYLGHTCLTLNIAYGSARLAGRPTVPWLMELINSGGRRTGRWDVDANMAGRAFSSAEGHNARRTRIACPVCGCRLLDTTLQGGIEHLTMTGEPDK